MPWIAHRRRGSEFGHHSFALVTPPLLLLALSPSSPRHSLVLQHPPLCAASADILTSGPLLCL